MGGFGIRDLFSDTAVARLIILVFLLVAIVSYVPVYLTNRAISKFPLVGKEVGSYSKRRQHFVTNAVDLINEGYRKVIKSLRAVQRDHLTQPQFKGLVWRVTSADGELLILPMKYVEELRALPDDVLNHLAGQRAILESKYTGLDPDVPLVIHAIKSDLTLHLNKAHNSHSLFLEVRREIRSHFGTSETWREVDIHKPFLNIVAIASGYVFLGPDLCRRPEFLHASIDFTEDLFRAAGTLKTWPQLLRPLGKYFVPEVQTLRDHYRSMYEFLVPIVRERRRLLLQGAGKEDVPEDMLQWMVRKAYEFDVRTDEELAENQLVLSFAAIHLTAMAATNLIYDLVGVSPEIIPELRKEILDVMRANDSVISIHALSQMKLLDSVMRESQRFNPAAIVRFVRKVMKPLRFSDGTEIPVGSNIALPLCTYDSSPFPGLEFDNADSHLRDPEYYPEPTIFNPHRFADMRSGVKEDPLNLINKEQYQFISPTKENTSFSLGRHACPGRFLASHEIKMMAVAILLEYDIKLPNGVEERYSNIAHVDHIMPDPTKTIMMRRVAAT
ncbi:hypothetical protein DL770_003727 [Monosporascus sp. CRB-9-2]|nr:hypothetical protein DL770_003727 [Monosporascus sp. CRB-9-2]